MYYFGVQSRKTVFGDWNRFNVVPTTDLLFCTTQ